MKRVFVDSSVLALAVGDDDPRKPHCRAVLAAAGEKRLILHASVESGQEFLFHHLRHTDRASAVQQFDAVDSMVEWHAFTPEILRSSRGLAAAGSVRGRDAVIAATALTAGFDEIVTCDSDFDGVPGLTRIDPPANRDLLR